VAEGVLTVFSYARGWAKVPVWLKSQFAAMLWLPATDFEFEYFCYFYF